MYGALRTRSTWPIGSVPAPKRFSATVWPITAFFAAPAWSEAVRPEPRAMLQLRMVKYSGVVP